MPEDVVRYGIISTAKIGLEKHIPAARHSPNSEIVAICSRDGGRAEDAAARHGIPRWYGSYEELIADDGVDAIINPLPNSMHCEWTIRSAEAGKHVLCEKPLAVDVDEARRMARAAESNNVLLVEAFTHRWSPHLRTARRLVQEEAIGPVISLSSAFTFTVRETRGNVRYSRELAGGSMMDAGCYAVYACRFVMGEEPLRAAAFSQDPGGFGVDTTLTGLMEYPEGAIAHVESSFEQPRRCNLIVIGARGRIEVPDMFDDSGPVVIEAGGERRMEAAPAPNRFTVQLDEFSQCILTGKAPEFPAEDGIRNTAAVAALMTAAERGKVVDVEQI